MKKQVFRTFVAVAIGVVGLAVPPSFADRAAPGQARGEDRGHGRFSMTDQRSSDGGVSFEEPQEAIVNVPFMFAAGSAVFPAGTYSIARQGDDPQIVQITSADGRHTAFVLTEWGSSVDNRSHAFLKFSNYAGDHVLTAVAMPGETVQTIQASKEALAKDAQMLAVARYQREHRG